MLAQRRLRSIPTAKLTSNVSMPTLHHVFLQALPQHHLITILVATRERKHVVKTLQYFVANYTQLGPANGARFNPVVAIGTHVVSLNTLWEWWNHKLVAHWTSEGVDD